MLAAFGVAYSQAAGNRQCILDGALSKRMQAGQAASAGVFSAFLAQTGFTGAYNIFNGRFGFFELYQPNGADPSALLRDLGTAFRGEALSYKPYPCGRPLHAAIDAALAARAQLQITADGGVCRVTPTPPVRAGRCGQEPIFASGGKCTNNTRAGPPIVRERWPRLPTSSARNTSPLPQRCFVPSLISISTVPDNTKRSWRREAGCQS
jgi:MmgE/PrpD N-terminal domain